MRNLLLPSVAALRLKSFESGRGEVPSLDGMRSISIISVMLLHMGFPWVPGGHGVFLFFIISGFLITRLFFAEQKEAGRISIRNFYMRRFFRLYPIIVVYCVVVSCSYYVRDSKMDILEPLSALLYFSNYLVAARDLTGIEYQMPFKVFWSLSVEEHFYIVFPVIMLLLRSPQRILIFAVGVCIAALGLRLAVAARYPEIVNTLFLYTRSEFRMDAVAYGVALAAACEFTAGQTILSRLIHPIGFIVALLISVAVILMGGTYFANVVRYAIFGPALAILMAAIIFSEKYRLFQLVLNLSPAVWIGKLSYSLYVWHLPCLALATLWLHGIIGVIIAWPLSFGVAAASYYFVERPVMRQRRKFGGQARQALSL